jgi:hypothetical protein
MLLSIPQSEERTMHALDVLKYGDLTALRAVHDLPEADWNTPGVCGHWSVREIIAHLASFEYLLVEALGVARGDPFGPYLTDWFRDASAFNDEQVAARADLSVAATLAEYEVTQGRAMAVAAALPPECFLTAGFLPQYGAEYDLEDFIIYNFYGHKREHSAQIAVFRDGIGR